jgi:hypothetical protein
MDAEALSLSKAKPSSSTIRRQCRQNLQELRLDKWIRRAVHRFIVIHIIQCSDLLLVNTRSPTIRAKTAATSAMQIVLPPELEDLIQRQLATGKYQTAIEVLLAGAKLLAQQEDIYSHPR